MSDDKNEKIDDTKKYFDTPATVAAFAELAGIKRDAAARRVRNAVEAGALKACGNETRAGVGRRAAMYQAS